jgi:hypothetical protein
VLDADALDDADNEHEHDECLKGVQSGPATDFVATKTPGMCKPCHGSVSLMISFALHWKDSHREHAELAQDVSEVVVDPLTYQLVLLELIQAGHSDIE